MIVLPKDWLDHIQVRPLVTPVVPSQEVPLGSEVGLFILMMSNDHGQFYAFYQSLVVPSGKPFDTWSKISEVCASIKHYMKTDIKKDLVLSGSAELSSKREKAKDQNWKFIDDENLMPLSEFLVDRFKDMVA